jgi:hypothetical protein
MLIVVQVIDLFDTYFKGVEWFMRPESVSVTAVTIAVAIIGFVSERHPIQLGVGIIAFSSQLVYVFGELGVLGSW